MNRGRLSSLILLGVALGAMSCQRPASPWRGLNADQLGQIATHRNLGVVYLEEGQYDKAVEEFQQLLEIAPRVSLAYGNLGIAYLEVGRYEAAEEVLKKGLRFAPDRADLHFILGMVYVRQGTGERGLDQLREALVHDPDHLPARYQLIQLLAGQGATADELLPQWREITRRDRENLVAHLNLLTLHAQRGDVGETRNLLAELAWWPNLSEDAFSFIDKVEEALEGPWPSQASRDLLVIQNLLKPSIPYQHSLSRLKETRYGLSITPIITFSPPLPPVTVDGSPATLSLRWRDVQSTVGLSEFEEETEEFALEDLDGDGDPDLVVLEGSQERARPVFLRNQNGRYAREDVGLSGRGPYRRAVLADLDNDGWIDISVHGPKGFRHFRSEQGRKFVATPAPTRGADQFLFLDIDRDGDLDLLGWQEELFVLQNRLDGTYLDVTADTGLRQVPAPPRDVAFADLDRDRAVDLFFVDHRGAGLWFLNHRLGRFHRIDTPARAAEGFRTVTAGDWDNDGWIDLLLMGEKNELLWNRRGVLEGAPLDGTFPSGFRSQDVVTLDFDNDGRLDLAVAGRTGEGDAGVWLLHNQGDGQFRLLPIPVSQATPGVRKIKAADFDSDGDLDLFLLTSTGRLTVLENQGGNRNPWLKIRPLGLTKGGTKNNSFAIGSILEVLAGPLYQARTVQSSVTHFGLGRQRRADVMRITWTNGQSQAVVSPAPNQLLTEQRMLRGSCPFLFAWNGERFAFVTDVFWRSLLGMLTPSGDYTSSEPARDTFKVPGRVLVADGGVYRLRLTSELWETGYLDEVVLLAADHPEEIEVYLNEAFSPDPSPAFRVYAVAEDRTPRAAWDSRGNDVLPLVRSRDGQYVGGERPTRYQGIMEEWSITLDLGDLSGAGDLTLFLQGWLFPIDTNIALAVSQRGGPPLEYPSVEVPDGQGGWKTVVSNIGAPAGKNKTVVVPLNFPFSEGDYRVRLRTTMEIYWDRIFFGTRLDGPVRVTRATPSAATLSYHGFSFPYREYPGGPVLFDYSRTLTAPVWPYAEGSYTRFGPVDELVEVADDRYVIFAPGDELDLRFRVADFPSVPEGWERDFFFYTEGWLKDGAPNSLLARTVEPLPFHGMSGYPPPGSESYPDDPLHGDYRREYNTRYRGGVPDDPVQILSELVESGWGGSVPGSARAVPGTMGGEGR